jgi:hypothetical protein
MIEAIREKPNEMQLFRAQIPKVAQAMLPVWKRQLYLPRTKCFED